MQIQAETRSFLESLLEDSDINKLDPQIKEEIIQELFDRLNNYINLVIINNIDPLYIDEFNKISKSNASQEKIEKFLLEKMPNAKQVFAQAFANFRDLYMQKAD